MGIVLPRAFRASSLADFSTISFRTNSETFTTTPATIPPRMTRPQLMDFMRLLLSEAADFEGNCRESSCTKHRPDAAPGSRGQALPGRLAADCGDLRPTHEAKSQGAPEGPDPSHAARPRGRYLALLGLSALGVVYGDIGTSPLYALRECFHGPHAIPPTPGNVLGVLSLVFWSLLVVICVKYLGFVMRADNRGEGGILALTALTGAHQGKARGGRRVLLLTGLFGAALLYGDGMITPAISVLSAVEGISIATPALERWVEPVTVVILIALFLVQRRGTAGLGAVFGPVMLLWFLAVAALGCARDLAFARGARRREPRPRRGLLRREPMARLPRPGHRLPRGDRGRGALCGHGPLRRAPDPDRLVRARAAVPARELLRAGGAAPRPTRRRSRTRSIA